MTGRRRKTLAGSRWWAPRSWRSFSPRASSVHPGSAARSSARRPRLSGGSSSIAGRFDLSFSPTATLTAGDVTLANAPWGSEPAMIRARLLRVDFELTSLWSGPVRVQNIELEDARVVLERDGGGTGNWELALPPRPPRDRTAPSRLEIARATIRGFELLYRSAPDAEPLALGVERIAATLDPVSRMIDLDGNGRLDAEPWSLSGRIGTLEAIRAGHDLEQALTATLGDAEDRSARTGARSARPRRAGRRGPRGGTRSRRRARTVRPPFRSGRPFPFPRPHHAGRERRRASTATAIWVESP